MLETVFTIISIGTLFIIVISLLVGQKLCAPATKPIAPPPEGLPVEDVSVARTKGGNLRAWLTLPEDNKPIILHLHGNTGDRNQIIGRVQFFHSLGYGNLAPDFQAHGESSGDKLSFGYYESEDVTAWVAYLRQRFPDRKIGLIGLSLGGAAALLAEQPLAVDCMVLEMVYSSIKDTVDNRMRGRLGKYGSWFTPFLIVQLKPILGICPVHLNPAEEVREITIPKFIIAGSADTKVTQSQSEQFFANAAEPKQFWLVEGAKHEDLHAFDKPEYEKRVLAFFQKWL
jgi:uncharacterized protein